MNTGNKNGFLNTDRQTDGQTDRQTEKSMKSIGTHWILHYGLSEGPSSGKILWAHVAHMARPRNFLEPPSPTNSEFQGENSLKKQWIPLDLVYGLCEGPSSGEILWAHVAHMARPRNCLEGAFPGKLRIPEIINEKAFDSIGFGILDFVRGPPRVKFCGPMWRTWRGQEIIWRRLPQQTQNSREQKSMRKRWIPLNFALWTL